MNPQLQSELTPDDIQPPDAPLLKENDRDSLVEHCVDLQVIFGLNKLSYINTAILGHMDSVWMWRLERDVLLSCADMPRAWSVGNTKV